jgi:hypothetical protein
MLILSQRDGAMSDALGLPLPDEIFGGVSPAEYAFMPHVYLFLWALQRVSAGGCAYGTASRLRMYSLSVLVSQRLATPLNAHIQRGARCVTYIPSYGEGSYSPFPVYVRKFPRRIR